MSNLPLFETLVDLETKVLKEKLVEKDERIVELEQENKELHESLTLAYMKGFSDGKAKLKEKKRE